MNKSGFTFLIVCMLFMTPVLAIAESASEAKQIWYTSKQASKDAQAEHRIAKITYAANKTSDNNQKVVDTGKAVLHAALDEVEAWLNWRYLDVEETLNLPSELKTALKNDVEINLEKIDALHEEVSEVKNQFQLGIVFIKIIVKYVELLTDVAKNTGLIWVHIGDTYVDTITEYEAELRTAAETLSNNTEILEKLDSAKSMIESAEQNLNHAESQYMMVILPGSPLIRFSNGNNYMRLARNDMLSAHNYLNQAYLLMVTGD